MRRLSLHTDEGLRLAAPLGDVAIPELRDCEAPVCEVYVIDDDDALRGALKRMLRGADLLVRTYATGAEFLDDAARLPPGCVVVDLRMPGLDGLELIRRIVAAGLPFRTIMITGDADVSLAVEVMKAGAVDFVPKPFDGPALLAAVRQALSRLETVNADSRSVGQFRDALARATPRERDVLRGLIDGKTNKSIARDLAISPRTIEAHRANLMKKLRVESLPELVRLSILAEDPQPRRASPARRDEANPGVAISPRSPSPRWPPPPAAARPCPG
jgi:two-component system response regulator FixJ